MLNSVFGNNSLVFSPPVAPVFPLPLTPIHQLANPRTCCEPDRLFSQFIQSYFKAALLHDLSLIFYLGTGVL